MNRWQQLQGSLEDLIALTLLFSHSSQTPGHNSFIFIFFEKNTGGVPHVRICAVDWGNEPFSSFRQVHSSRNPNRFTLMRTFSVINRHAIPLGKGKKRRAWRSKLEGRTV
jgi:hypothetical protein